MEKDVPRDLQETLKEIREMESMVRRIEDYGIRPDGYRLIFPWGREF